MNPPATPSGGDRWVGRLKKLFHKSQHSFGYIECVNFDPPYGTEDVYVYAMDIVQGLKLPPPRGAKGDCVKGLDRFIGEFLEFTPQRNERGVKALRPFVHMSGDFEGRPDMELALDQRSQQRLHALKDDFTNLYVRNIPVTWCENDMQNLFNPYGLIRSMVLQKDEKDETVFGRVNFAEPEQAKAAVSALHACELDVGDGKFTLYVQPFQNQSERADVRCQGYVERLREDLTAVLQSQAKAQIDLTETLPDYLCWFALHKWHPERSFAGASLGEFAEKARQKFGESVPKKVYGFAEGVSGVSVWKHKGNPYVYPSDVFKMLNRFGESDIERLHKSPASTATVCASCSCPRIVGREDPNDHVWRCVGCFIGWYGWYPWTDSGVEKLAGRGAGGHKPKGKKGNQEKKNGKRGKK